MIEGWMPQEETTILDLPDYYVALEEFRRGEDQMIFMHITVHNWTVRVFKEILRNWKLFREYVTCPLYAVGGVEDVEKWEAFVSALGFQFLTDVICENGAKRRLFIHIKKEKNNERQVSAKLDLQSEWHVHVKPVVNTNPVSDAGV